MALTDGICESLGLINRKIKRIREQIENKDNDTSIINIDQITFAIEVMIETLDQGMINEIRLITETKEE